MIKELIVVEGKNDAHVVRLALGDVDILWTEGYGLSKKKLDYIAEMANRQGVIVFTDPDTVGEQIRNRIRKYVPLAKHTYLTRKAATKQGDIGVENADSSAAAGLLLGLAGIMCHSSQTVFRGVGAATIRGALYRRVVGRGSQCLRV